MHFMHFDPWKPPHPSLQTQPIHASSCTTLLRTLSTLRTSVYKCTNTDGAWTNQAPDRRPKCPFKFQEPCAVLGEARTLISLDSPKGLPAIPWRVAKALEVSPINLCDLASCLWRVMIVQFLDAVHAVLGQVHGIGLAVLCQPAAAAAWAAVCRQAVTQLHPLPPHCCPP